MSNYTKLTDFASKDTLPSGNANKIVKGVEIDDEFEAIETAIATKADSSNPSLTNASIAGATLTGTVTAPTAASGTDSTAVATTAFVQDALTGSLGSNTSDITVNSVTLGDWKMEDDGSTVLKIFYNSVPIFKLESNGHLTVTGDITAFGTVA